mmetsp:Transcript_48585/g.150346  ORF Transcript_48585/g.150346 Transcript_48585/m.150346 type:complete len:502 (-) Transcript_48585:307-1812(-)
MDLAVELPPRGNGSTAGGAVYRYRAVAKLGGGSFGDILAAVNESDPQDWTALKIEARHRANDMDRKRAESSMVRFERLVCQEVAHGASVGRTSMGPDGGRSRRCPCPMVRGCVSLHGEHDVLAMELLGPNLRDYATTLGHWPLPEDLVLVLGAALVGRLQQLHACGFVHRDLKPENLVLRLESSEDEGAVPCLKLVDYAMAMRFAKPGGAGHICKREDAEVAGTHRYMAIHAQRGVTQSRRSDLESLANVLVYLALGQLPWQHLQEVTEMLQRKEQCSIAELCEGLRPSFAHFLQRCRDLEFDEAPDYELLQRTLLAGVKGPVDFEAARVRRSFKQQLHEVYLRHEATRAAAACLPPALLSPVPVPNGALWSMLPIFVRHDARNDATELVAYQPTCAADLDDRRSFFFEAYREPLPGTVHVVVGSCHFFGFLQEEFLSVAHSEAGLEPGAPEQILVFSLGRRDWVARSATLRDYDASTGKAYREWNLRCSFWSRVVLTSHA